MTRKQSDDNFLLIPGEEANVHFGGHWGLAFPKPVFWHQSRKDGQTPMTAEMHIGFFAKESAENCRPAETRIIVVKMLEHRYPDDHNRRSTR